jgi:hypothetical protein
LIMSFLIFLLLNAIDMKDQELIRLEDCLGCYLEVDLLELRDTRYEFSGSTLKLSYLHCSAGYHATDLVHGTGIRPPR